MIQSCIASQLHDWKIWRVLLFVEWKHLLLSCFSQQMPPIKSMVGDRNHTSVVMSCLLGISDNKELQLNVFPIFLGMYLVTLICNLGLIILISMDSHFHTPMYFFFSVLSFIDISYSSSTNSRMLSSFFNIEKMISFVACATQDFVASCWGLTECCLCSSWPMTGLLLWTAPAILHRHGSWPLPEEGCWGLWEWFPW